MIKDAILKKYLNKHQVIISDDNLNSTIDILVNFISNNLYPELSGLEKYQMRVLLVDRLLFIDPGESIYAYGSTDPESTSDSLKRLLDNFKNHRIITPCFNYVITKSTNKQYDLLTNVTDSSFIKHLNYSE